MCRIRIDKLVKEYKRWSILSYLTEEQLTEWFQSYRALPAAAAALPFIEAFLPFLPLVVFVVANTNAFGLWEGFSVVARVCGRIDADVLCRPPFRTEKSFRFHPQASDHKADDALG